MRNLYTIRDVLIGFGLAQPAIIDLPNDEVARRVVKGSVAKGAAPNYLNANPEDKELWCIGEFDERTGQIKAIKPRLVCKCIDFLGHEEVENNDRSN